MTFQKLIFAACSLLVLATGFTDPEPKPSAMLYEISGNGLESPSYLLGTMHVICPDDLDMQATGVADAVAASKRVVMELDLDDPALMGKAQQLSVSGEDFTTYLTEEETTQLDGFFKKSAGVGLEQLKMLKPMALVALGFAAYLPCEATGVEMEIIKLAQAGKLPVEGLETVEEQMALAFDALTIEEQADYLADFLTDEDAAQVYVDEFRGVYLAGEVEQLYEQSISEFGTTFSVEYGRSLLDDRNQNWIAPMEGYMSDGSTFFAVGAAHLGGEKGVLKLLRDQGYTVTRL